MSSSRHWRFRGTSPMGKQSRRGSGQAKRMLIPAGRKQPVLGECPGFVTRIDVWPAIFVARSARKHQGKSPHLHFATYTSLASACSGTAARAEPPRQNTSRPVVATLIPASPRGESSGSDPDERSVHRVEEGSGRVTVIRGGPRAPLTRRYRWVASPCPDNACPLTRRGQPLPRADFRGARRSRRGSSPDILRVHLYPE